VKYEGSEKISLPNSISREVIENRIESWLKTKIGSRYKIQKKDSEEFVLKRTWLDTSCQLYFIISFIGIVLELVTFPTITSFGFFLVGIIVIIYFYFIFPSRVIIHTNIRDSNISLWLESTHKEEAEQDFDSLIDEIRGDSVRSLETLH
jgi:hypothetical protein